MTAILSLIWCWLQDVFGLLTDWTLGLWDEFLKIPDAALQSVSSSGGLQALPSIADQYAWVLGATGCSQALALVGAAMLIRFTLQAIPFVRWGN